MPRLVPGAGAVYRATRNTESPCRADQIYVSQAKKVEKDAAKEAAAKEEGDEKPAKRCNLGPAGQEGIGENQMLVWLCCAVAHQHHLNQCYAT